MKCAVVRVRTHSAVPSPTAHSASLKPADPSSRESSASAESFAKQNSTAMKSDTPPQPTSDPHSKTLAASQRYCTPADSPDCPSPTSDQWARRKTQLP